MNLSVFMEGGHVFYLTFDDQKALEEFTHYIDYGGEVPQTVLGHCRGIPGTLHFRIRPASVVAYRGPNEVSR